MNVSLTGAYRQVGTAVIDHLADETQYEFTRPDREDQQDHETVVADVADPGAVRAAVKGHDPVAQAVRPVGRCPRKQNCRHVQRDVGG